MLLECMNSLGGKWARIATKIPGRTGKQCRERYLGQFLQNKQPWTVDENKVILNNIYQHGMHLRCVKFVAYCV